MRPRRVHIAAGHDEGSDDGAPRDERSSSSDRLPAARHVLTAVVLLGVGLLGLATTNLFLTLDADEVGSWIEPRASSALNRPVTVGGATLSIWPRPAVRVADVRVGNLPGFDGPGLAHVDEARLDVSWLPLIVGRVHVRRLSLEGARLHLAVDPSGTSNFGDFVPRPTDAGEGIPEPLALRIREIEVSDGTLTYFDEEGDRSLVVIGGEATADLRRDEEGGWRSVVTARSDSLLVRVAGVGAEIVRAAGPTARLSARGGDPAGTIEIEGGHVALATDTLAVYGAISLSEREPTFDVLFTNEGLSAAFVTALFPVKARSDLLPRVEGTLDVIVQLRGMAGEPPSLRGAVRMRDVALRLRGEPMVDGVGGVLTVSPDTISFDSVAGHFAGGPFELSGAIMRSAGTAAFVVRGEPDLDALDRLGLLGDGTTLSGDAQLYVSVAGPSSSLDSLEFVGVAEVRGLQLEHAGLGVPIYVPAGELTLVGREARWSEVAVLVGQDRLETTGAVADLFDLWPSEDTTPAIELTVSGPRLDLNKALPPRDTTSAASYAQLALAHLGGRLIDERTPSVVAAARGLSRPERLPAVGSVAIELDTLVFRRHRLSAVSARLELGDSTLRVADASFVAWDGSAAGSLWLGVGRGAEQPFELELSLDGAAAEPFLSVMSPVGETVRGVLDLELHVTGSTDASMLPVGRDLAGEVTMTLEDGEVAGTGLNMALADFLGADAWLDVPFDRWVVDMRIQERVLEIREADLTGDAGAVAMSGPVRLDGSAELSMGVSIPADRLEGVSLRRTGIGQSVLEQLRAAGGSLDLGLRLSGWIQAPTLEPDASQAVALARTRS